PVATWPAAQRDAARALDLGEPVDLAGGMPEVAAESDSETVVKLAGEIAGRASRQGAAGAFVVGEFTLSLALVAELQRRGIGCFAAASTRDVTTTERADGAKERSVVFRFVRFREYAMLARP